MEQERIVKGIWIPIEIWKDKNLNWNEKILLLEIDSFTSSERDCYFSDEYISQMLGISITNANKTLSSLIKKGYVVKTRFDGRRRYVRAALTAATEQPCQNRQSSPVKIDRPASNIYNNNIEVNNTMNNTEKKEKILKEQKEAFQKVWLAYGRKGSKKIAFERWCKLSEKEREKMNKHIPFYVVSSEHQFIKDLERYISNKTFESIVIDKKSGRVLYDPERESGEIEYTPMTNYSLVWNEIEKKYVYIGMFLEQLSDGYTDETRPDGALIMLNNARGDVKWNAQKREWEKVV